MSLILLFGLGLTTFAQDGRRRVASLYPEDHRRAMQEGDYARYRGAGILFCNDRNGVPRRAAAAWLIGSPRLVMMNAHNFRGRRGDPTRTIDDCYFQIGGRNYEFDGKSLELGVAPGARALHITDDWALVRLRAPVDDKDPPQPMPKPLGLPTGPTPIAVTMVSPAGHANFRLATTSIETCRIVAIEPPSEDGIRSVRHDCNDGFGGSGSGLFDDAGRLVAMHSASLDMDRRLPFDIDTHYGLGLLIEGSLLDSIRRKANE